MFIVVLSKVRDSLAFFMTTIYNRITNQSKIINIMKNLLNIGEKPKPNHSRGCNILMLFFVSLLIVWIYFDNRYAEDKAKASKEPDKVTTIVLGADTIRVNQYGEVIN